MIWSEQELARLAICKNEVIADKVFSHLSEPDNQDIWQKGNFSLIWGLLGTAGVKGIAPDVADKVWIIIIENKVLDAYDKGILDDFNKHLMQQYHDERMRGWINLDNYTAGIKFKKTILEPLAKLSAKVKADTEVMYPNPEKLIERFTVMGDMSKLKAYLERIKPITNDETAFGIDVIFDKEQSLKKLDNAVAYMMRSLREDEKDYLWYYLFDAVNKGFLPEKIGLTDQMVARLVAATPDKSDSELKGSLLQNRNENINEFVQSLENNGDFYEETAAKMIMFNPDEVANVVAKCLDFAKLHDNPKGVVLALSLINLKQIKSAVTLLLALAEKGAVTEACGYMHRLLPLAKGGESVVSDLLKTNLLKLKERSVLVKNEAYQAYVSRYYLLAAKAFIEVGCHNEAAELLNFAVNEAWFEPKSELADDFKAEANCLLQQNKEVLSLLKGAITKLGFSVYNEPNAVYIGESEDNPLTAARHRVEESIKEATTFDVSGVLDNMATVENGAYNVLQNLKINLKKKDEDVSLAQVPEAEPQILESAEVSEPLTPVEEVKHWEEPKSNIKENNESFISGLKRFRNKIADKVNLDIDSVLKVSSLDIDKHFGKIKQAADEAINLAKEQVSGVKEKMEKIDVSNVTSMVKVQNLAKKLKFKHKKNE